MPERIRAESFRAQYGSSRYPFADTASLLTTDGSREFPAAAITDASLYPPSADGRVIYMSSVVVSDGTVTLHFSDGTGRTVAAAEFRPADVGDVVAVYDSYGRPAGVLVNGNGSMAELSAWPEATYLFKKDAAAMAPRCVIPTPETGVRGILTDDGELLTGDVLIVGDNGVVARTGNVTGSIRIDVVGDPLFRRKLCRPIQLFETPRFLRTINGCEGDAYGNFTITAGDNIAAQTVVRIYAKDGSLVIEAVGNTL